MKESETINFKKSLAELKVGIAPVADLRSRIHMVEAWRRGMPLILRNAPSVQPREISHILSPVWAGRRLKQNNRLVMEEMS